MKAVYVSLEELLDKAAGSLYALVVGVAKRAQEIASGAKPLVEGQVNKDKPVTVAIQEVQLGLVSFVKPKKKKK